MLSIRPTARQITICQHYLQDVSARRITGDPALIDIYHALLREVSEHNRADPAWQTRWLPYGDEPQ